MQVKPGDTIATITCPDCGQETALKVTKTFTLFVFCRNVTGQKENGKPERCWHREFWGREKSRRVIAEFEAMNPAEPETIIEVTEEKTDGNQISETKNEPASHGIGHNGGPARGDDAGPAAPEPAAPRPKWYERPLFGGGGDTSSA